MQLLLSLPAAETKVRVRSCGLRRRGRQQANESGCEQDG
jgi:hypothetical protein